MPDRSGWDRKPGFDLDGSGAVVLGADTRSGAAIADSLQDAGATVARIAANATGTAPTSDGDCWDVRDPAAIERGMAAVMAAQPSTILVTALNVAQFAPLAEAGVSAYRAVMAVNLDAVYFACRAFLANLAADAADARIICVTSVFGERGIDDGAAYAAAQGGVQNLVRALAQEVGARNGMTVNGIATGWMADTPGRGPDEIGRNRLMRFVPMRRFGEPAESGPLAVLLASRASGYISGQILHVDGGVTTHL